MGIRRSLGAAATALALGLSLGACGGDGDGGTTGSAGQTARSAATEQFAAAVTEASRPVSAWPGPDSGTGPAKAKKIVVITCSSQGAGCVSAAKGATEAGEVLGWTVKTIDGKGNPQAWNAGILTAISEKADGIALAAVPPALVGDAVARARAAKIPVVSIFNPKVGPSGGVFAYVRPEHRDQGVKMADWVAADSGGEARVVLVEDNQFPELVQRVEGFRAELARCEGCELVATVRSQIQTMAQNLPQAIVSALQTHPDATHVISPFDSNALFAAQGVRQAGKAATVKVGGYEGDPQAVDAIRTGQIQAATIADPTEWMGWQAIDEFTRAFAGEPAANVPVPWRLLTKANVPSGSGWAGDFDFRSAYRRLWGVA
jgi:ribose transport system substrate-binding protein